MATRMVEINGQFGGKDGAEAKQPTDLANTVSIDLASLKKKYPVSYWSRLLTEYTLISVHGSYLMNVLKWAADVRSNWYRVPEVRRVYNFSMMAMATMKGFADTSGRRWLVAHGMSWTVGSLSSTSMTVSMFQAAVCSAVVVPSLKKFAFGIIARSRSTWDCCPYGRTNCSLCPTTLSASSSAPSSPRKQAAVAADMLCRSLCARSIRVRERRSSVCRLRV